MGKLSQSTAEVKRSLASYSVPLRFIDGSDDVDGSDGTDGSDDIGGRKPCRIHAYRSRSREGLYTHVQTPK